MGPVPALQPTRSKRGRPADESRRQDKDKGLYHCDYCAKDLSHVPRIKCAVCPDYDLCLECFSVGAQIWPHASDHGYRVVDNLSFPLYHPEWGADEELLLLEAIDMYGLGNWGPDPLHRNSVADHVGMKNGLECRHHYYSVYINTDSFPLPKAAPEMANVDIPKLIEAHRSSGQQRMTVQSGGAAGAAGAGMQPPAKRPRPPAHPAVAGLGGADADAAVAAAMAAGIKVEEGVGAEVKQEPKQEPAGAAAGTAGAAAGAADTAQPMEVDVKAEAGGSGAPEAAPGPTQQQAQQAGAAEGGAAAPAAEAQQQQQQQGQQPPPQHHPQTGEKGRKHAAAKHHAAAAAAAPPLPGAEIKSEGGAGEAGAAAAAQAAAQAVAKATAEPAEPAHTTTATFGLRLTAVPSVGEDLSGWAGGAAGAAGRGALATPMAGASAGGPATGGKSPATADAAAAAAAGAVVGTSDAQQTGYHVKRNEFEPEYDNDAESIVAELEFSPDDSPEEVARKLRLVDIYNRRLDERDRRKAFVLERGLVNVRRQQAADRRRSAPERDLQARLRVFARYLPQEQFEALAEGMAVEARLRARILELCEYRAAGLRTFEQVDAAEAALEASGLARKKEADNRPPPTSKTKPQRTIVDEGALQGQLLALGMPHAAQGLEIQRTTLAEGKGTSTALQAWRSRRGALLDITSLPDAEPLNQKERALCASERYLPAQYLAVKAALLKVQEAKGSVSRADVQQLPFQVDPARLLRLLDFMAQQGWVTTV